MPSLAILIGNTDYRAMSKLECCHDDVHAINELLKATEKFEEVIIIENAEADALKTQFRNALDKVKSPEELFLYFTGHGHVHEMEFYHCATNFDAKRPNETGLSTTELHTLLRPSDARLVVKVIDACYSGTPLVKSERVWLPLGKDGFHNLIQIASSLDTQTSLAGDPLSVFTRKFRDAALRKTDGPVFYTDIISTLRDAFIDNDSQTPHFVSQGTGREQFIDDAKRLEHLRASLEEARAADAAEAQSGQLAAPTPASLLDRLRAADAKIVTPELMSRFVGSFFDSLIKTLSDGDFGEFYSHDVIEHSHFEERTAERFIILVLQKEKRADNFVTAHYSRKLRNPMTAVALLQHYFDDDAYVESQTLRLNCTMERAQLKITLTPKFNNLQRIVLVVTCAPSLDCCYIFEITTQHMLQDFGKFDTGGSELSRRWWKRAWTESTEGVVQQIAAKFDDATRKQLEDAETRLSKNSIPVAH
jgi:caspase domain-containing protein